MKRLNLLGLGLLIVALALSLPAWPTIAQNVACYLDQGGAGFHLGNGCTQTVESGGVLNVASGGALQIAGSALTGSAAELNVLHGVTAGTAAASKAVVLDSSKKIDVLDITQLKVGGTDLTTVATNAVDGLAAGYKVARGTVTLDGSNPTPAATGLTTIVACSLMPQGSSAPGLDPVSFWGNPSGATLNIYAYKSTSNADPTQIDSTNAAVIVHWACVGT